MLPRQKEIRLVAPVELIFLLVGTFFIYKSRVVISESLIAFVKGLVGFLGESAEGDVSWFTLQCFSQMVLQFLKLTALVLVSLGPFVIGYLVEEPAPLTVVLSAAFCYFLAFLTIRKAQSSQGKASLDQSFIDRILLYFFYFDLRWSLQLSEFSFRIKSQRGIIGDGVHRNSIFIISIARSATTAMSTKLIAQPNCAGLLYRHLPFTLCPEFIGSFSKRKNRSSKRLHLDENYQDLDTSDAFDEPMMVILDHYKDEKVYLAKLNTWHKRLSKALNAENLIFKNNNNFKRLPKIMNYGHAKFLVVFRCPFKTAESLRNNHVHFVELASADPFFRDYLHILRHKEFGPLVDLTKDSGSVNIEDLCTYDYWLKAWIEFAELTLESYTKTPQKFWFFCSDEQITDQHAEAVAEQLFSGARCWADHEAKGNMKPDKSKFDGELAIAAAALYTSLLKEVR